MSDNPWNDLRAALADHDSMFKPGQDPLTPEQLAKKVENIAKAADGIAERTSVGEAGPADHSMLILNAMRVIGIAICSKHLVKYHLAGVKGPFMKMLTDLGR